MLLDTKLLKESKDSYAKSSTEMRIFMIYEITETKNVAFLFDKWDETLIWSCLQKIMGKIYANHLTCPTSAMAIIGDFTFFAGNPCAELITYKPDWCTQDFMIMVPQNKKWEAMIVQLYGNKAKIVSRYATKKEPDIFNVQHLKTIAESLSNEYTIHKINEYFYHMCKSEKWSVDLVSLFKNDKEYCKWGLGIIILKDHTIVSGASSYSRYQEGIEIEIDTKKEYQQKGLASVCGAQLILECLKQHLYPSWDAQNEISLALAKKLGYHYSHTYTAIEIWGY